MMNFGLFVTGSGTGVGKTYFSELLLKGFAALGYKTTYMKPIETGCGGDDIGTDTRRALNAASCRGDIDRHSPYRFAPACSPHLAARESGRVISIDKIVSCYNELADDTSADIIIVEGAGGVLVPVNDNEYMLDVIKALGIPAAVVVDAGLGTLNHTFLTLRELERAGVPIAAVAVNNARGIERDFVYEDNAAAIREYIKPVPCVDVGYDVGYDQGGSACGVSAEFISELFARMR